MDVIVRTYISLHSYIGGGTQELRSTMKYIECSGLMYLVLCTYAGASRYVLHKPTYVYRTRYIGAAKYD